MNFYRVILLILGTLSLGIGLIGLLIPGLPTTPFILLTAGLYVRSSDKLYQRLISNKVVGPYIREFSNNKGMTRQTKVYAICTMWLMIGLSVIFGIKLLPIRIIVLIVGLIGTLVMGFIVPTVNKKSSKNIDDQL